jgi:AraC-like DNA-binding protein
VHSIPTRKEHYGRERCASADLPRHRHAAGYVTLVLRGRYVEAGDSGRYAACAGDVLIHAPFEAHRDTFTHSPAEVINLPLVEGLCGRRFGFVADPDRIARTAETDLVAAARQVALDLEDQPGEQDWPDLLSSALAAARPVRVGAWAREHSLHGSTVSRGFQQVFGTTPCRYRAEARARRALTAIAQSALPLAQLAADLGFADQAHMTRAVAAMTGCPPARWRRLHQLGNESRAAARSTAPGGTPAAGARLARYEPSPALTLSS